jgi:HEAT repeat protein
MKLTSVFILIATLSVFSISSPVLGQTLSETDRIVDSLFIMSSSTLIQNQSLVEPSKKALAEMGVAAVPRMIAKLSSEDARERHAIADIFKRIGSVAIPALTDALRDENLYALRNAARCLGEIGDKSAVHALLPLFSHAEYTVRETAVTSVGQCHDSTALSPCLALLADTVDVVRKSATVAIGRIADSRAIDALIDVLDDPHFSVRMSAVTALVAIGRPACDSLLARYAVLSDISKLLAFDVWASSHYKPASSLMEKETRASDPHVRGFAVSALAAVDPKKAHNRIKKMKAEETDLFVLSQISTAEKTMALPKK